MNKCLFFAFLSIVSISCSVSKTKNSYPDFSSVKIDTLLNEKLSSRAILIDKKKVWYAGAGGKLGCISLNAKNQNYSKTIEHDNLKLEFRSIAHTSDYIFVLTVANPALLFRISKDSKEIKLVYKEKHEKVFYDSMQFLNNLEGFAIGDPTENCPSFIKTADGGETWQKVNCSTLPKFEEGEAFFAASNTNLILKGNKMFMVSGGKKSRVFVSEDKGKSWVVSETPIVQGKTMTGAFCADFYNEKTGMIAGGDYEKLTQNFQNKAITNDGGKTWQLTAENSGFGYASCVQYFPESEGKSIVEVGAAGLFYSADAGKSWKQLSKDPDFLTIRFIDAKTAVATGKNRIVKITFQ